MKYKNDNCVCKSSTIYTPYRLNWLVAIAMAASFTLAGCDKIASHDPDTQKETKEPPFQWRKVDMEVGSTKIPLTVGRFEKAVKNRPVALDKTRWDTPLNAWVALQSYRQKGKDEMDLRALAKHYTNPDEFQRFNPSAEKFFEEAQKADEQPLAAGYIKYGTYTIVVESFHRRHRGVCMVQRGDQWYIDETSKLTEPVLKELIINEYKILKGGEESK